ncbi:DNA-3-methyladenine glycosylase 2 family protein [Fusibacter paucivorans]|uniref:DNA-3-methyladenine glycosylase II n=1 Tax=Fusibacter paucivorans TaxID=76009 RepID=A0ABS5PJV5_9FIRM|nr:DNA-3-methyladenine glycosylase 2 family protein [Fusibacter paucivorans]MBS7525429.1 DNA-3-methyladenine glycosylase 2 family protein [Fusibacter paucivorans]
MQQLQTTQSACDCLANDPIMAKLMDTIGPLSYALSDNQFTGLASTIIGQQLSNKVASVIWGRLHTYLEGNVTPDSVLAADAASLRALGISYAKIRYIKDLAEHVKDGRLVFDELPTMADDDVMKKLTAVKGIGQWTAEMYMIFALGRKDIFSLGDASLQGAIQSLYGVAGKTSLIELSDKWQPYRSIASLYLWAYIDQDIQSLWA